MRNARGNARWVNDRGEFEGVELGTWTNRVTVSGGSAWNTVEGVDFDPPRPLTNRIAPSIRELFTPRAYFASSVNAKRH